MSFVDREEILGKRGPNLAPMIDFLFLMLLFFASLAVSRIVTQDTEIDLVQTTKGAQQEKVSDDLTKTITVSINDQGTYKWVTEVKDYPMKDAEAIQQELQKQYSLGSLPKDKEHTVVLIKADRNTRWQPIMDAIFAVQDAGFRARPVYIPKRESE